jgi:hypothetical protein
MDERVDSLKRTAAMSAEPKSAAFVSRLATADIGRFGPYRFVRRLESTRTASRYLALHERDLTSHVVYRIPLKASVGVHKRFLGLVQALAELDHPHVQSISQYAIDEKGRGCIVTPHRGHAEGLTTLGSLLSMKGGRMIAVEAHRTMRQMLTAADHAHARSQAHGPVQMDQVLIDRHGKTMLELYGLERRLSGHDETFEVLVRAEVLSIVAIGYRLLTGFRPDVPPVPVTEVLKRLVDKHEAKCIDPAWNEFFAVGMKSYGGYATAAAALDAMPRLGAVKPPSMVSRTVGRWFKTR